MYIYIYIQWFPGFGLSSPGLSDGPGSGHSVDLESDSMRNDTRICQDMIQQDMDIMSYTVACYKGK